MANPSALGAQIVQQVGSALMVITKKILASNANLVKLPQERDLLAAVCVILASLELNLEYVKSAQLDATKIQRVKLIA